MKNYFYVSGTTDGWQNLAADEWFLDHLDEDEMVLYFYVNRNAVIIGKNQNPWKECNLAAMDRDGVQLVRRVTGGGAVFHDEGNLNFSFIAGRERYDQDKQFDLILQAVRSLGIPCEFSGRNDLLADGRKFSGNAFCSRGHNRQHHGTLLISADMTRLQHYLQVDPRKLQAKGVSSVRSRVCNLSEFRPDLSVPVMLEALRRAYARSYDGYTDFRPTPAQAAEIARYCEKHSSWEWRIGGTPQFDIEIETRFPWGGVQLLLMLRDGCVAELRVFSDAMDVELTEDVKQRLLGCRFGSRPLADALLSSGKSQLHDLAEYILSENL